MARTERTPRPPRGSRTQRGTTEAGRPVRGGRRPRTPALPALLAAAAATAVPAGPVLTDRWSHTAHRMARVAVWALPAYAVTQLWLAVRPVPDPATDPVGWAAEVTSTGYLRAQVALGLGGALLGLVAMVALAALLAGARSRRWAGAGLLVGLAAAVLQVSRQGLAVFAAPALGEQVQAGNLAAASGFQQAFVPDSLAPLAGPGLATLAWVLLAIAVYRSGALSRSDGVLLALAAPLLGVASGYLPVLAPLGALLLLAAGIGIAWSGGRLVGGGRSRGRLVPGAALR